MALDARAIKNITRGIIYGSGLGEKPSIVAAAASAGGTVAGQTISFDLAAGGGDSVRAGDVLSIYDAANEDDAHSLYIMSKSTDTIVAVNGYEGSAAAASGDFNGLLFEVMPLVTDHELYRAVDVVIERHLWPEVFDITADTVTPNLVTGQVAMDTDDEEILDAWQKVSTQLIPIPSHLEKGMPTALFSTGKMGSFDFIDGSTTYYSAKRRISLTNSTADDSLNVLIATGAAAIALGGTQVEETLDSAKKDAQDRSQRDIAAIIWRDFLTQKQVHSEDLSRDVVDHFVVNRG